MTEQKINRATAPQAENEGVLHLELKPGDVPPYVLLPGAPERTEIIGSTWDEHKLVAYNREYRTVSGVYKNTPMATVSTGIGTASSEICIHELNTLGVHTCIRVGSTGSIVPEFDLGDLIILLGAVRRDGTSDSYIDPAFPAYADFRVVNALQEACENLGYRYGFGIAYTAASFYIGQARPLREDGTGYWSSDKDHLIEDLRRAGVTNIEMEAAGQFVVGALHGMRMGGIMSVLANRVTDRWGDQGGEVKACRAASEALAILARKDKENESQYCIRKGYKI
ncbi:MAG: nucleoside phosphorylase [Fastidiosipilaceae bacterium]|nr:nucleoside phosphorylase [Clostridiaceae bacterium]